MRTTIRLDDSLLMQAKQKAASEGTTFTALVERGLRLVLAKPPVGERGPRVPVSQCVGGLQPGVDLLSNAALQDLLEEEGEWS